jgi:hypothetical protein
MQTTNSICMLCSKSISLTNQCTTICGHTYCLSCLLTVISNNQPICPYCKTDLTDTNISENEVHPPIDPPNQEYIGSIDDFEDEKLGCVDDIAKILIEKEVTMVDVLSYFDNRYNSRSPSHRHRNHICHHYYAEYMKQTIESAFNDVDSYASL